MIITSLLDTDLYKFTMQQVVFHRFPRAEVKYEFSNRDANIDLWPFAGEIREEIDQLASLALSGEEAKYLKEIRFLSPSYVDSLQRLRLNPAAVTIETRDTVTLSVAGNWYETILFEVPLLAIINEVYNRNVQPDTEQARAEGIRRIEEKCRLVREAGLPEFNLVEFGTRRRYSADWQRTVVREFQSRLPEYLNGTSNVKLAREFGLKPFGTMAHEFLQACQAFAPLPDFQKYAFEQWMQEYRGDLGIALSDVVGMDAFLRDFDLLFSKAYDGARHDSGDPYVWCEKLIAHYRSMKIDPRTKYAVFSDALTIPKSLDLARRFYEQIQTAFGIGTNLTNDLGYTPLQVVIKMTQCDGRPVAKLSDSPGKTICRDETYLNYLREVFKK